MFNDQVAINGTISHILDVTNPSGTFQDGVRQREYSTRSMLPTSGKLIAEFSGRRSIRDMFSKKSSGPSVASGSQPANEASDRPSVRGSQREVTASAPKTPLRSSQEPGFTSPTRASAAKDASSPAVGGKRNFPEKVGPRPLKRSKSGNTSASGPSNVAEKGQKSLKGFFKPKQDQPASQSHGNEKGASDLGS